MGGGGQKASGARVLVGDLQMALRFRGETLLALDLGELEMTASDRQLTRGALHCALVFRVQHHLLDRIGVSIESIPGDAGHANRRGGE
jgi:hypothetical protein